jgi:hypothetical protein
MTQYLWAAYRVADLSVSQHAVLNAYASRADEHGYCYPGRQRVALDTSLSPRAVQYAKQELIKRGLIAVKPRTTKEGRQTTDIVRVNLAMMKKLARPEQDFGDNLIEEIFFDEPDVPEGGEQQLLPPLEEGSSSCSPGGAAAAPPGEHPMLPINVQNERAGSSTSSRSEVEDERDAPSGGKRTQGEGPVTVTGADVMHANTLMSAIPWPNRRMALSTKTKRVIMDRLAELSAGGWEAGDVTAYVNTQIPDWKAVRRPADLVVSVLGDAPTRLSEAFTDAPQAREEPTEPEVDPELAEARAEHERLKALKLQQKALIDDCSVCDEMGWFIPVGGGTMVWHDHGKMGLNTEVNRAGRRLAQIEEKLAGEDQQVWEFARK